MRFSFVLVPLAAAVLTIAPAHAQYPDPLDIRACTDIEIDAQRLSCYDRATHRDEGAPPAAGRGELPESFRHDAERQADSAPVARDLLDSRWELDPASKLGTFNIRGFRPVYVMPVFATTDRNTLPHSPNPNNTATAPLDLDPVEAKFQLSLKMKVWQGVFGEQGDLWLGYTQSSRWQVYNKDQSRPFRETDYEPELMLVFGTHYRVGGWDGRLLGVGIDHQSNGQGDPLSRSWNRIVAQAGFERDGWTVMLRPWWRISESSRIDNNADIEDYVGRGELQVLHVSGAQEFGLALRHSLRTGDDSHGSARFSWSFPMAGHLRGYLEAFTGYGESLIDYNHRATYLGFGVSLLDWY